MYLSAKERSRTMGREARLAAAARAQAGSIPIRIGRKRGRKDRALAEKKRQIFLPVKHGEVPLREHELKDVFAGARKVKEDVAAGRIPNERVDLSQQALP